MALAKYFEDIQEDIEINLAKVSPFYRIRREPASAHCVCPYCGDEYGDSGTLYSHMRSEHNSLPTVLLLNDSILEPGEYINAAAETLRLFPNKKIETLRVNGNCQDVGGEAGYVDLKPDNDFETLIIQADEQEWIIYRSHLEPVDLRVHDIVSEMNSSATNRMRPNLDHIRDLISDYHLGIRDEQYIYGFCEYCFACLGNGNNDMYYSAYNRLLPFIELDARARLAVKIICLRFLWLDKLDALCANAAPNEFSHVCAFLKGETALALKEVPVDNIFDIFVEDDEYDNIQAIVHFMNGDLNAVRRYLGKTDAIAKNRPPGDPLVDRINLLKARLSERDGRIDLSKRYLRSIVGTALSQLKDAK